MQNHMPIGYQMKNGKIVIQEYEKEIVTRIYRDYLKGKAANQIAKELCAEQVLGKNGKVTWTHVSVGKILENRQYLGNECYPSIIEWELFEKVQEKREQFRIQHRKGIQGSKKREIRLFSGKLICATCGANYGHYENRHKEKRLPPKWRCKNDVYQNQIICKNGGITDAEVQQVCLDAINQIIQNKNIYRNITEEPKRKSLEVVKLEIQIEKAMEKEEEYEKVEHFIYQRAALQYQNLSVRDREEKTKAMERKLEGRKEQKEFEEEIFENLIQAIWIHKERIAEVEFINGSKIPIPY